MLLQLLRDGHPSSSSSSSSCWMAWWRVCSSPRSCHVFLERKSQRVDTMQQRGEACPAGGGHDRTTWALPSASSVSSRVSL